MAAAGATAGSTLHNVTENQKRWLVFGIALSKVLVSQIRPFVETEIQKENANFKLAMAFMLRAHLGVSCTGNGQIS